MRRHMRLALSWLIVQGCFCACGQNDQSRSASDRAAVETCLERLAADCVGMPSVDASNRLVQLKATALPMLFDMFSILKLSGREAGQKDCCRLCSPRHQRASAPE